MIWSFEREGATQRCEIRRDADGQFYELAMTDPEGTERTERFEDPSELIARSVDFMRGLLDSGWRPPQFTDRRP
jgi:hypothetical protein